MADISATSIDQLTLEVKFYLSQTAQNIIEVGKRLIQAKEILPHGDFGKWLELNFSLSISTARKFIRCAERFGITRDVARFQPSQMLELLALPEAETENFIAQKQAEGKDVADMTVRQLREEIKQYKAQIDKAAADNLQLQEQLKAKPAVVEKIPADYEANKHALITLQSENRQLQEQLKTKPAVVEKLPADYEANKQAIAALQNEKALLQRKLKIAEETITYPDDYEPNRKELTAKIAEVEALKKQIAAKDAEIQTKIDFEEYAATAQKIDAVSNLVSELIRSTNTGKILAEYERNHNSRFNLLHAQLKTFLKIIES